MNSPSELRTIQLVFYKRTIMCVCMLVFLGAQSIGSVHWPPKRSNKISMHLYRLGEYCKADFDKISLSAPVPGGESHYNFV